MGGGRIATPPDSPAAVMATANKNPVKFPDGDAGPMQQVVIANRLTDGVVVFLGRDRQWVTYLKDCPPAETPEEAEALLAMGVEAENNQEIVGPELIEVQDQNGTLAPIKMREAMRARGPSIRTDLGKQAGN